MVGSKNTENPKFGKYRNKYLSLYMQYYNTPFGDIVATSERAKATNTYSAVNLEVGEDFIEVIGDDDGKEGSGDSDDNIIEPSPNLFQSASLKSGRSSGSKRKKSGAEYVREGLDDLVVAMSCRSTQTTTTNADVSLL
ncbi:uncharacterized protein LOC141687391 [Apium graveolens]|uniref:uncharacterized protein LOC141687391 n=1 Tax=Apium graveolens TaxID=4045 RepID=UPI003D797F03